MSSATHDAVAVTAVTNRLQVRSLWYLNDVSTATRCRSTVPRIIWSLRRALSPTLLQTLSAFLARRMLDDAAAGEVKYNERWELRRRTMRSCPQAISMHGGTMNRLCLVNICRDTGYRDLLHLACASVVYHDCCRVVRSEFWIRQRPFSSLDGLVLDLPLPQDMLQKLLRLIPFFLVLKNSRIVSKSNETSLGMFSRFCRRIGQINSRFS